MTIILVNEIQKNVSAIGCRRSCKTKIIISKKREDEKYYVQKLMRRKLYVKDYNSFAYSKERTHNKTFQLLNNSIRFVEPLPYFCREKNAEAYLPLLQS
jgi:hypothetical protein